MAFVQQFIKIIYENSKFKGCSLFQLFVFAKNNVSEKQLFLRLTKNS